MSSHILQAQKCFLKRFTIIILLCALIHSTPLRSCMHYVLLKSTVFCSSRLCPCWLASTSVRPSGLIYARLQKSTTSSSIQVSESNHLFSLQHPRQLIHGIASVQLGRKSCVRIFVRSGLSVLFEPPRILAQPSKIRDLKHSFH